MEKIVRGWRDQVARHFPPVTEDTMPGELANIVAGRVANVLNLRGPNFITDAACASSFAAIAFRHPYGLDEFTIAQRHEVTNRSVDRLKLLFNAWKPDRVLVGELLTKLLRQCGDGAQRAQALTVHGLKQLASSVRWLLIIPG
jgi:hypothetical protein